MLNYIFANSSIYKLIGEAYYHKAEVKYKISQLESVQQKS